MQNQSSQIFRLGTLLIDAVLLVALFAMMGWWRFDDLRISNPEYYNYYLQLLVLTVVSWYAAGRWAGMFTYTSGLEQRNVTANLFRGALVQFAILAIIVVGLKGYYYSRFFLASYFISLYALALIYRLIFVQFLRNQMAHGRWQRGFVVSGANLTSQALIELSALRPDLGWRYEGAPESAQADNVQDLICAHTAGSQAYEQALEQAQHNGWRFRYLPEMGAQYAGEMHLESLEGIPLFSQRSEPLANWANSLLKRILDLVLSVFFLLTVASWLVPLCSLLLVFSGAGKPWFIQEREGQEGQSFYVLKLRTMNDKGSSNYLQRWLRKSGLDELPQLINVLFGQMSMVGPRPHTAGDGVHYASKAASYKIRHWAKPGLTGLAQVRGLRGGESAQSDELLEARIRADVYYVEHWSIFLDLRILLETAIRTLFAPSSLHTHQ